MNNMLRKSNEKCRQHEKTEGNVNRKKKRRKEILEIENKVTEMRVFDRLIRSLDIDEERISELKIGQQKFQN